MVARSRPRNRPEQHRGKQDQQVAIIGAGPYGLAAAARLRTEGLAPCVFGETMSFWERQMPAGMFLRSSHTASSIMDPSGSLSLGSYEAVHGLRREVPVPRDTFIDYGHWFQQQAVPEVDPRKVSRVARIPGAFRLTLEDGQSLVFERVVVAAGISAFASRPPEFDQLHGALASHSSDHDDLKRFRGQRVAVVGGGQSAVEYAAMLMESGADVELLVRQPGIRWLRDRSVFRGSAWRARLEKLLYRSTDVGPPGLSWVVAFPDIFRMLPLSLQAPVAYRSIRPAAAAWLHQRVEGLKITPSRRVVSATAEGKEVRLVLDDGTDRRVDHVLLATGYRVDISGYAFLDSELLSGIVRVGGYPVLGPGFESSVPGLHFLGAPASRSYGPVVRFVSGTWYSARSLASRIASNPRVASLAA